MAVLESFKHARPALRRKRREESAGAFGGGAVRDSFEGVNFAGGDAADFTRGGGNGGADGAASGVK